MRPPLPIELLTIAAEKLGDLRDEVVFVGGAVVGLLLTDPGAPPPRVTHDVDVAIEVSGSLLEDRALDRRLLGLGFSNDIYGPTCRYRHGETVLDVIPVSGHDDGINRWYRLAMTTAQKRVLPNRIPIRVIAAECFLATKLAAFGSPDREHHHDPLLSRDFGDIVRVLDGRPTIVGEVMNARDDLREFVRSGLRSLLASRYVEEAVADHVDAGRERLTIERMEEIARR